MQREREREVEHPKSQLVRTSHLTDTQLRLPNFNKKIGDQERPLCL